MSSQATVETFYSKTIQKTEDFVFDACCVAAYDPKLLDAITDEVKAKRYGCGSPLPPLLQGSTVLDLGSGAGIDVFVAAQLVGENGRAIGVDMTNELLEISRRNIDPIMKNIGYAKPNVEFLHGKIEEIPVEADSVDVVISNCVINLTQEKERVFREIYRVLKPGGEFYIADIVADRRVPKRLIEDDRLHNECLTGAAYTGDLRRICARAGFADVRTVDQRRLNDRVEGIRFDSVTLRGFKLPLEDACEDYGQVAVYHGTIPGHERAFLLDRSHNFGAGVTNRVCKNTADMLKGSRFSPHFSVSEELMHLGLFEVCGTEPIDEEVPSSSGCC